MKKFLLTSSSNLSLFRRTVYAFVVVLGFSASANAQCIGPYQVFESCRAKGAIGTAGTMVDDGWVFSASAVVATGATNARTGLSVIQLSNITQYVVTPKLANPDKFQFYYRTSSAGRAVNGLIEWSTDPTFTVGVFNSPFTTSTTTLFTPSTVIDLSAFTDVYVRISSVSYVTLAAAIRVDDISWTSRIPSENIVIVPDTVPAPGAITDPYTCNAVTVPAAGTGTYSFYDQGGKHDTYNISRTQTLYFAPTVGGEKVKFTFNSFAVNTGTTITVYNGNGVTVGTEFADLDAATTVAAGTTVTSTDPTGYITVVFTTSATAPAAANTGFDITVECVGAPTIASLSGSGCSGEALVITGTNLLAPSAVTVGGVAVSSIVSNTGTVLTVIPAAGSSGTVAVTTAAGSVTSVATYTANLLPTISSQPSNGTQTICLNGVATALSVTATAGSGTIQNYQWYSNTTATLVGATLVATTATAATTDTYTPLTTAEGTLYYYVVVTNSNGCTVTSAFTGAIIINAPVVITVQPSVTAQSVCVGAPITALSVTATGGGLNYQWHSNSTNSNVGGTSLGVAGQASTYTPSNASAMATTYYYCVVSNGAPCGSTVTSAVSGGITVNGLPAAVGVSGAGTFCTSANLNTSFFGVATIYFQGTTSGGTSTATEATSQTVSASGTYYFRAYNGTCWGPEGSATVTIVAPPVAPAIAAATAITANSFSANWILVSGATNYFLDVATDAGFTSLLPSFSNLSVGNVNTRSVTGLSPSATYWYRVRANNGSCSGPSSASVSCLTSGLTYCIPTGTFQDPLGITNVTLGTINNTTGLEAGSYGNYSSLSSNVFIGATVPFSVTYRTGYSYNTYIWVDWNNDGDFIDIDELVYVGNSTNAVPTTLSGTFAVPLLNSNSVSTLGSHRLRIGGVDFDDPSDPCRNGSWQAYEDYTINVITVPPCAVSTPAALTTVNVTGTGASLVWSDPAMTPNTVYNYWVSTTNTPPAATCANPVGMGTVTGVLSANVTGLTLGVQYYFWVRVKCGPTTCGPWIGSATFTTANLDVVNMTNGSIATCNARFYDSGGFAGNYTNSEDFTYTFIPASGTNLKVVFNSFSLEQNYDFLSIYDGPTTASPLLGTFTGTQIAAGQTFFSSTANGGRLTFRFTSDISVTPAGWDANITCVSVPLITSFTPTFTCAGSTPIITITGSNFTGATSVSFNGVIVPINATNITGAGTIITVTLPAAATSGLIRVIKPEATGSSTTPFEVRPIPATPTASADVAICNGQSTNLNVVVPPINNTLATTQVGGNGCTGGNMFNIVTGSNPIRITSFDITPEVAGAQNVNVYYRVGTYLGNETTVGSWILLGTYPINGPARILLNMPVAALNLSASTTYGIYLNYNASYTNGTNTYSNTDITINTGVGLCSAFGGVNASRTFNGAVRYQVNVTPTYTWTPSTGLSSPTIANPVATPTSTTTYNVTTTVNGCTSLPDSVVVTVNPVPTVTIPTPSANICANAVTPVTVSGSATTYTWTSNVANTLFSDATGTTPYIPGANITTIYVKSPSTVVITATGTALPSGCFATAAVTFTVTTKTYNSGFWTPGGPPINDGTENLVFNAGIYTSTGNLSACSCSVTGATVVIDSGHSLTLVNGLTVSSGDLSFNNNASLIQVNNVANTGNITYRRDAQIKRLDYVYWSSPVNNYTINNITPPLLPFSTIYKWNTIVPNGTGGQGNWQNASGDPMIKGKGYIARAPTSFPTTAITFNGTFVGVPTNGDISMPIQRGDITTTAGLYPAAPFAGTNGTITEDMDNWNLVGNPYPSAIDAINFLTTNTDIQGFIYLWTHDSAPTAGGNPFYGDFAFNYADDYITYNDLGVSNPINYFLGNIAAGQGFFVSMNNGPAASSTVIFNNGMRNGANSQFFRTTTSEIEKHRVWLQLVDENDVAVPTLVGYAPNATVGLDRLYDAKKDNVNDLNIFSIVDDQMLTIQGRPTPFDVNDQVPLGVSLTQEGEYKIAIGAVDGLFEQGQAIYVEDKLLNTIHDLRQTPYSFSSEAGIVTDRFVLRYTNETLGVPTFSENTVVVYKNKAGLHINSGDLSMRSAAIFDVTGRLIAVQNSVNATQTSFTNLPSTNQVLLVQITSETGLVVTKKIVY